METTTITVNSFTQVEKYSRRKLLKVALFGTGFYITCNKTQLKRAFRHPDLKGKKLSFELDIYSNVVYINSINYN